MAIISLCTCTLFFEDCSEGPPNKSIHVNYFGLFLENEINLERTMNKAFIVLIDQYNQELIKENYLIYFLSYTKTILWL